MGILKNRNDPIIDNRNPDNDIEDFNALFEIQALDCIDPWDETDDTIKSTDTNIEEKQVEIEKSIPILQKPAVIMEKSIEPIKPDNSADVPGKNVKPSVSVKIPMTKSESKPLIKPKDDAISQALILNNKGVVLSRLGRYDDAIKIYDLALKINPNYPLAWNNKGVVLSRMGRLNEAIAAYDRALSISR